MTNAVRMFPLLVAPLATALIGCGRGGPVQVEGIITLDDRPVAGATVTFIPAAAGGHPATGLTDADGRFHLTTVRAGDGAHRGEYRVHVSKQEAKVPDGPRWTEYWDDEHNKRKHAVEYYGMLWKTAATRGKSLVPTAYSDPSRTPLRCTVPARGAVALRLSSAQP